MLPIIGSIIGFLGSIAPQVLKLYQDKRDKEHELKLLQLQIEREKLGHTHKMEEIGAIADIEESKALYRSLEPKLSGVKWVDAMITFLISSVRPVITYSFFLVYALVKIGMYQKLGDITQIWNEMDMTIFCTIISFWFGNRSMQKFFRK